VLPLMLPMPQLVSKGFLVEEPSVGSGAVSKWVSV